MGQLNGEIWRAELCKAVDKLVNVASQSSALH